MAFIPLGFLGGGLGGRLLRPGVENLSADHLLSGTITGQQIIIAGGTDGVIRSQNYNTTNEGWALFGDGTTRIRSSILSVGSSKNLTISSGVITITQSYHQIDTESAASSDNLDTINGGTEGDILVLRSVASARDVVVRDDVGNVRLAGSADFTIGTSDDVLFLLFIETRWVEISRSTN